jgi:hypothetical protein
MAEEKDAAELAAEKEEGEELPPLPPIPPQITPSNGDKRRTQREPGQWLNENSVEPPPGSFTGEEGYGAAAAPTAPPASTEGAEQRRGRDGGSVRVLSKQADESSDDAYPADADGEPTERLRRRPAKKTATKRAPAKRAARSSSDSDES